MDLKAAGGTGASFRPADRDCRLLARPGPATLRILPEVRVPSAASVSASLSEPRGAICAAVGRSTPDQCFTSYYSESNKPLLSPVIETGAVVSPTYCRTPILHMLQSI